MSDFLTNSWYFAALSRDAKPGAMQRLEICGEPVALGRTSSGEAFALRDICPHRAAPLTAGRITQEDDGSASVECPYHGWRFGVGDGACRAIPSLVADQDLDVERIRVRRFATHESDGLIWVYFAASKHDDGPPATPPPELPVAVDGKPKLVERATFACHVDHAVVGLMDPAHGPYVHRQWWWRSGSSMHEKAKTFAPSELGFSMVAHQPSSNSYGYRVLGGAPTTEITFRLPGVRFETIRNEKHTVLSFTAVTPANANETRITQVFFWDAPLLSLLRPIMRPAARTFLRQDGDMVNLQQEGLRYDPNLMLIDDADMQAKWYYRLKREWAAAQAEGRAFVNPVEETVLRWRS